jgi:hypothetical protein
MMKQSPFLKGTDGCRNQTVWRLPLEILRAPTPHPSRRRRTKPYPVHPRAAQCVGAELCQLPVRQPQLTQGPRGLGRPDTSPRDGCSGKSHLRFFFRSPPWLYRSSSHQARGELSLVTILGDLFAVCAVQRRVRCDNLHVHDGDFSPPRSDNVGSSDPNNRLIGDFSPNTPTPLRKMY